MARNLNVIAAINPMRIPAADFVIKRAIFIINSIPAGRLSDYKFTSLKQKANVVPIVSYVTLPI